MKIFKYVLVLFVLCITSWACSFILSSDKVLESQVNYVLESAKNNSISSTSAQADNDKKDITEVFIDTFDKEVLQYKGIVVFEFEQDGCAPCKALEPDFAKLAKYFSSYKNVKFTKFNMNTNLDKLQNLSKEKKTEGKNAIKKIMEKYDIETTPHFVIFKNGVNKKTMSNKKGIIEDIEKAVKENL